MSVRLSRSGGNPLADKPTIVLPPDAVRVLEIRSPKCFVCAMILRDFRENGKLTDGPKDWAGVGTYPVDGKLKHLKLEGISLLLQ